MNDVLPDIPRVYTALAEWLACVVYISILKRTLAGWKLATFAGVVLVLQTAFLVLTKDLPIVLWIPSMLIAVGMMFVLIYISCDITATEAGYFSVKAFVAAELVASLQWQVHVFLLNSQNSFLHLEILLLFVIYGGAFLLIWLLERPHLPVEGKLNIQRRELWSTVLIGAAVFGISNLSFVTASTPFSGHYAREILNIRTLVDLGGFAILYAYHIQLNESRVRHELKAVQNMFQNQYAQYQQSKESIDLINYKYHDMKNQIIALRSEEDPEKRKRYLTDMENEIKAFEAQHKTGNHVLDTLLASKHMYCIKNKITLTCVADGTLLKDMDVIDICTIFGNALDNAIEHVQEMNDEEKRLIHVSLFAQKGFLMMRFENYFEGALVLDGDLPVTTKKDKYNHGFGIKSIRYTVQKYGGVVNVDLKDNWFELKVLIPLTP
ncbi:GHKL domain-containing protein [Anaerobacillus isosaccharinicus]|uniref:ATP-binding protein n=1 Tax=Anaerobacillus isosaccharinicus TaxID=1532552 RepID=A0A1S2MEU5_9BACI|nr:ATP-binding protein [Anaerobacillus isosaccharinicus]MBA5586513.1 sensor histidine kinase [Anaerobacillus isosaccharinicus]QOY35246.1 sensor histidine kinase [Anaerobacillus isosaccharinicus]